MRSSVRAGRRGDIPRREGSLDEPSDVGGQLTDARSTRGSLASSTVNGVATTYAADGLNRVIGVTRGETTLGFPHGGVRAARNLRPWIGNFIIDIDKPKPKPLPPLIPVPV